MHTGQWGGPVLHGRWDGLSCPGTDSGGRQVHRHGRTKVRTLSSDGFHFLSDMQQDYNPRVGRRLRRQRRREMVG